jgi:hypothetical protein
MVLRRAISGVKRVLGLKAPGRDLAVFPDDTFLVSFPKSGNTWARFLLANILRPGEVVDFSNVNEVIPGPDVTPNRELLRMRRPRVVKSHQYFDPRYPRVIYIVRDPRDVAVSQYHFQRKRRLFADDYPIEDFVTRFVAGETCDYASWGEHVASWVSTRAGQPGFLLIRYEDMIQDTARELSHMATFLGLNVSPDMIRDAVTRSSAEKMRNLEKSQAQLFAITKDTRQDVPFVRAANSGGWQSSLPHPCVAQIETAWASLMRYLGYELTTCSASAPGASDLIMSSISER